MTKKDKIKIVLKHLKDRYPESKCSLYHKDTYQLLVAVVLSAQCKDERVNKVTPILFGKYPTPKDMAYAEIEDIAKIIFSLGFYRTKAKSIKEASRVIHESYNDEIIGDIETLIKLPGVGRKTANVVLNEYFIPVGVVVDTHVGRISGRLGLTNSNKSNAEKIEQDLMKILPKNEWRDFSHRVIYFGREICDAKKPLCLKCPFIKICCYYGNKL